MTISPQSFSEPGPDRLAETARDRAKELGYDAGFGPRTTPLEVASFLAQEVVRRHEES